MSGRGFSRRGFFKAATAAAVGSLGSNPAFAGEPSSAEKNCGSNWEPPQKQQGNNLNLIVIVCDSFRRDNLACYGSKWLPNLETPNLDRFAEKAVIFKDAYPEGMPTIVIRRTLYTGRRVLPYYAFPDGDGALPGWHPLYHEDVTFGETLLEAGYVNALISSLYHEFKPGKNFQRGFHTWRWIRGLEVDDYGTSPHGLLDVSDLVSSDYMKQFPSLHRFLSQYKANRERP